MMKCAYKNILESGTVSLAAGTEDPSYPLYRLYDRNVSRKFRATAAETVEIKVDQSAYLLIDTFDDNSIDSDKWSVADTGANITETGQHIEGKGSNTWNANGLVSKDSIALSPNLTCRFTVTPKHGQNNPGIFGLFASSSLSTQAEGIGVRFSGSMALDVWHNGSNQTTGRTYQADKTYHFRILYTNPGWEVHVQSTDDTVFQSEVLIFATLAESTGPVYFHANFFSSGGITHLDSVIAYNASVTHAIDRLIIPAEHNLLGAVLAVEYSDNDITYIRALPQWTGETGLINKSWTPSAHRYWKFTITSPISIPELSEIFLTVTYEWERNPSRPAGPFEESFNVEHTQTSDGADRFLVHGAPRRQRRYHVPRCGESQKDNALALYSEYGGHSPFWLEDHGGEWIYGRLDSPINLVEVSHQSYSFDFDFMEVTG